ncbi:MAG: DUF2809 domain-containing protein [Firmicutes bacterium]|nr:DUF2809 domain-containing protein [Bacillota bacterium]
MKNFSVAVALAVIEVLILNFVDDTAVKYYAGDIIGIFFLYFLCRSFAGENMLLPVGVLIIAVAIDAAKIYGIGEMITEKIGSENIYVNEFIYAVIGREFEMEDIICCIVGVIFIYLGIGVKKMLGRE